jgi:trans-2,3-dihydro-3-hydroxyanthranilate isomerase
MTDRTEHRQHLRFYIVDVFTHEPLAGNPLAVVTDAQGLDEVLMQRIAREFNQSETTFALPSTRPDADWQLRSFTPSGAEVFGAGHNALGAWWLLAEAGLLALDAPRTAFLQQIGDSVLPVEVAVSDAGRPTAIEMSQAPPSFGVVHEDLSALAAALNLAQGDLFLKGLKAQVVSTGATHLLVPVRDRQAVEHARPNAEHLGSLLRAVGGQGCYLFCLEPLDPAAIAYARFFNPSVNIWEDPATGSAAGPLACYLVARGIVEDCTMIVVEQGHAMGRPSRIEVCVRGGDVWISGSAVVVADGNLRL